MMSLTLYNLKITSISVIQPDQRELALVTTNYDYQHESNLPCVICPISAREAGNSTVTRLGLRMLTGGVDHLFSGDREEKA
ncbi:hypothetical protein EVAR_61414_1 [Eumeta japonica]|uniref:Uncharacterized protein n=1 Tax=Eumeta variegata TaxID=151549 RepID=A0A4C1YXX9_EUMVA|nr:hypothetical protein EVAR_61414_1 [Eumeta japonica]